MAEARRNWINWFAFGALFICTYAQCFAQSRFSSPPPPHSAQIQSPLSGSLAGRLTDLHSAPLAGVSVVLRNQITGAESRATTAKNGAFRFAALEAGNYTLEADEAKRGHGRLDGILVTGGAEVRVQAAMRFEPIAPFQNAAPTLGRVIAPSESVATFRAISAPRQGSVLPATALAKLPMSLPASPIPPLTASSPASAAFKAAEQPLLPALTAPRRPSLETQFAATHFALAIAQLRTLPLSPGVAPALATCAASANSVQASIVDLSPLARLMDEVQKPDPVTHAVATTVTATQLQVLPVSGRRWQEFLLETPASSATADLSQASFRGAQESAEVTVDGANTRLAFGALAGSGSASSDPSGQGATPQNSMSQDWAGGRGLGVSEAAVREVTTAAGNVEAEGMHSAGGRAAIRTESGGNTLHGKGFFFDRQNTWGARNPFTQWLQNIGSAAVPNFTAAPYTPPDHEIVWGLGMGSRIRRDKLFWFAALDSNHRNDPGVATAKNPAEFFNLPEPTSAPVTLLSAQLGESQNQAYNDYLGIAASGYAPAGLEELAALLGPAPRTAVQWVGFARIDWQATERHHFTLEGIGTHSIAAGGGASRISETYGNHSFGSRVASRQWLLARWEAYLTPNLLAVTQSSAGRDIVDTAPSTPSLFEQSLLSGNFWGQLPQIIVDSRYGFTIGNPSRFGQGSYPDERLYHGQEMLDWVHNHLLVKSGFELDHNADSTSLLRNQTGTYHYSNVASFISDALAFQKFGFVDALDPRNPHNCGTTDTKFGSQPCYSYYSQTMGPTDWHLSTNDWAGYVTAQWQLAKLAVFSAGLRWEREQLPPSIATLANPELPLTQSLPTLGNNWGPRVSLALGAAKNLWPVLRLGYGMYYGRTMNSTLETALTQTGSLRGDLSFFMRPSDDCQFCSGGAPPFPYVFAGQPSSVVKPGAVEVAPNFRNPEIHQAVAAVEQPLPSHTELTASVMFSLGRRLPISVDTNFDPAFNPRTITYNVKDPTGKGPIRSAQITVPFYASWPSAASPTGTAGRLNPDYQQISEITSRANSTYEAAMIRIAREVRRGLSLNAHYTYAHAMDWNPNETTLVAGSDVLDPANFIQEYGTSNLDTRHSAAVMAIFEAPWKLHGFTSRIANGWMISGIGQFRSGLPYTMRTSGSLPEEFTISGAAIAGLGPGMNGSGGDNRVYGVGRNTFRYPHTWKADLRLAKRFDLGDMRQLELLAETFNLFNHQNVTELETSGYSIESSGSSSTLPTLCYLTINTIGSANCGTTTATGLGSPIAAFGQPLNINGTNFYRERQIQLGLQMRF